MKLGSRSASPFYTLRNKLLIHEDADLQPFMKTQEGQEASVFWEDLQRETSSRKRIYGIANAHRIERELVERFGVFKAFVAHPYSYGGDVVLFLLLSIKIHYDYTGGDWCSAQSPCSRTN